MLLTHQAHQSLCHLFQKRRKKIFKNASFVKIAKKRDLKLTSTEAGRNVITEASKSLKDVLMHGLRDADITNIKYHVNTCYVNYGREKQQLELNRNNDISSSTPLFANTGSPNAACSRAKKAKTVGYHISHVKNCIVCNQKKCRRDSQKLRT